MTGELFRCSQCGACCVGEGSVFLYPEDISALAAFFHETLQQTVDRVTDYILMELCEDGGSFLYIPYLILKKEANRACCLLREDRCSVHAAKPVQCRETPFVEEFFTDREWQAQVRSLCRGLARMTDGEISAQAARFSESTAREEEYFRLLRENAFNLEKIVGVVLPSPRIVTGTDTEAEETE